MPDWIGWAVAGLAITGAVVAMFVVEREARRRDAKIDALERALERRRV
jgi:hypothetical protein